MRSALRSAALARPQVTSLLTPRTSAFLPSIRFSSTSSAAKTTTTTPPKTTARPYVISLTPSNQFPVYARTKAAGSSKFTIVKKIEGNKKAFAQDLAREAGFAEEEVKLNPITGHVQVKGFHVEKVKEWLITALGDPAKLA
ncbi:54S ribosomal protein img2, mitochondrial [Colletotrichum sp. CLE4]